MSSKRKSKDVEENKSSASKRAKLSPQTRAKTPAKTTAKTPVKTKAKTPVKPRAKTPVKTRAKTPVKTRAKTPVKPRAKTPVKPRTVEKPKTNVTVTPKPKAKTPEKPRAKTPSSIGKECQIKTPPSVLVTHSFDVISTGRPRAWEEKAAQVMREHLQQINTTTQSKTKELTGSTSCEESNSNNRYLQAYWNLPALKHRDELPPCYFRACIFDGYRDQWTWHEATMSLFSMHNETMCIWSHLIPLLCAIAVAVWLSVQMQMDGSTFVEQLMFGIYITTACTCLCMSSLYHWYGCMSPGHYLCLLSFDLGGIACLIAGSFFPGVYYGFYCTPVLQKIYIGVTCLIFLIGMVISLFGATESPNAASIRQAGFGSLTIFGFVPLCHWLLIAPNAYKDAMTIGALGMFFFYGLGFSFLLTSFPESVWTNNYITTYLVPSHSLWHLGVAAAIFTWLYALLGQQQLLREMGCQAFDDYIDEFDMRSYAF